MEYLPAELLVEILLKLQNYDLIALARTNKMMLMRVWRYTLFQMHHNIHINTVTVWNIMGFGINNHLGKVVEYCTNIFITKYFENEAIDQLTRFDIDQRFFVPPERNAMRYAGVHNPQRAIYFKTLDQCRTMLRQIILEYAHKNNKILGFFKYVTKIDIQ